MQGCRVVHLFLLKKMESFFKSKVGEIHIASNMGQSFDITF
jgi:hypothetical protein